MYSASELFQWLGLHVLVHFASVLQPQDSGLEPEDGGPGGRDQGERHGRGSSAKDVSISACIAPTGRMHGTRVEFDFRVIAVNAAGDSIPSNIVTVVL